MRMVHTAGTSKRKCLMVFPKLEVRPQNSLLFFQTVKRRFPREFAGSGDSAVVATKLQLGESNVEFRDV